MKATKFVSIIAILAFASSAHKKEESIQPVKSDVLHRAYEYLWLVITIYQYIDPCKFILSQHNDYFTVVVFSNHTEYLVYGNQEEWEDFFKKDLKIDPMSFKILLN